MKSKRNNLISEEPHSDKSGKKLNWLRAAVLGSNDGIISVASMVAGVAGASNSAQNILTAGVAGLVAGAFSMAVGEYVSVSSQRDSEKVLLEKERSELAGSSEKELDELVGLYEAKGLSNPTARLVASELTTQDAFASHVDIELGIDPNNLINPWSAAGASAVAFCFGGVIPLIAIIIPPESFRIPVMFVSVLVALVVTGILSAMMGGANKVRATVRVVFGGSVAMVVTFGVGKLFGMVGI